jgi:hypothetical protein
MAKSDEDPPMTLERALDFGSQQQLGYGIVSQSRSSDDEIASGIASQSSIERASGELARSVRERIEMLARIARETPDGSDRVGRTRQISQLTGRIMRTGPHDGSSREGSTRPLILPLIEREVLRRRQRHYESFMDRILSAEHSREPAHPPPTASIPEPVLESTVEEIPMYRPMDFWFDRDIRPGVPFYRSYGRRDIDINFMGEFDSFGGRSDMVCVIPETFFEGETDFCAISQEEIKKGASIFETPCEHVFKYENIEKYFNHEIQHMKSITCPLCRTKLDIDIVSKEEYDEIQKTLKISKKDKKRKVKKIKSSMTVVKTRHGDFVNHMRIPVSRPKTRIPFVSVRDFLDNVTTNTVAEETSDGGLRMIINFGYDDVYLTGDPEIDAISIPDDSDTVIELEIPNHTMTKKQFHIKKKNILHKSRKQRKIKNPKFRQCSHKRKYR